MNRPFNVRTMSIFLIFVQLFMSCAHDDAGVIAAIESGQTDDVVEFIEATIYYEKSSSKTAIIYTKEGYKKTFKNGERIDQISEAAPNPVVLPEGVDPDHHEIHEDVAWDDKTAIERTTIASSGDAHPIQGAYYVSPDGDSGKDGLSAGNSWTLAHALKTAKAGDVVYIKAGNYGALKLTQSNDGTADKMIRFIGYKATPGDINSEEGSTFSDKESANASNYPLLKGSDYNSTALQINGSYVSVENLQITGYRQAIRSEGDGNHFKNVILLEQGNQGTSGYDGFGLFILGSNCTVENSFFRNQTAEALKLSGGTDNLVKYSKVYANNPTNPLDYYFIITGNGKNNIIEHCEAERTADLSHGGHGFSMKDRAENNIVRNCVVKKSNFEVNFKGVKNNLFTDNVILGSGTETGDWPSQISINNGANNNTFQNFYIQDTWNAIHFREYDDGYVGPDGDNDEASLGYDNKFINIVVNNSRRALNFDGNTNLGQASADRNYFYNCTFYNVYTLAVNYYNNNDTRFYNCIIDNVGRSDLYVEYGDKYAPYSKFDVSFYNCNFSNKSFSNPSGENITSHEPEFSDAGSNKFHLKSTSKLINIGRSHSYTTDFDGKARPRGGAFDLGAYEN